MEATLPHPLPFQAPDRPLHWLPLALPPALPIDACPTLRGSYQSLGRQGFLAPRARPRRRVCTVRSMTAPLRVCRAMTGTAVPHSQVVGRAHPGRWHHRLLAALQQEWAFGAPLCPGNTGWSLPCALLHPTAGPKCPLTTPRRAREVWLGPPSSYGPLWSPPKAGRKILSFNVLGAEAKIWCHHG